MLVDCPTRPVADVKCSAADQVLNSPHIRLNILGLRSKIRPTRAELSISARQKHFPASTREHPNPDTLTGRDASQLLRSSGD
jgi:hypothetical protein